MKIDYLPTDRKVPGQKYCLVTVVGPKYNQKCDMYAVKVRGVAATKSEAEKMCQDIMKYDNKFDTYVTEVGLFFPIEIDPANAKNVVHANERLNSLVKSYTENRIEAENQFHIRKQQMMEEAIKEGKNQEELANRPEHPVSVYSRMNDSKTHIKELEAQIKALEQDHELAKEKWEGVYTQEERNEALGILENKVDQQTKELENEHGTDVNVNADQVTAQAIKEIEEKHEQETSLSFEEIQNNIRKQLTQNTLDELKKNDTQIKELTNTLEITSLGENSKRVLGEQLDALKEKRTKLVQDLQSQNTNDFINGSFAPTDFGDNVIPQPRDS